MNPHSKYRIAGLVGITLLASLAAMGFFWTRALPWQRFAEITGFTLPSGAVLTRNIVEETGTFGTDGTRGYEFKVDAGILRKWRSESPFHGQSSWKTGPVTEGLVLGFPIPPAEVLRSKEVFYAIKEGGQDERDTLVLNPKTGRVWLVSTWW